jgi:GAF domain-containing protein
MQQAHPRHRPADGAERRIVASHPTAPLGAPAGGRFDRLTRLVRQVLRVPAALVWLPGAERRLFFAAQVPSEPWAGLRRKAAPSHAFCRAVVEAGLPLAVADAREDARVRGNPALEGLGVVACLAVPLALPDGREVGALCALNTQRANC